jgi:N-hydroxyarylamine O-acetyltransferase
MTEAGRFPLAEYCARTGASLNGAPTGERLMELHRAQLLSIPFENLDIALGRGIDVALENLIDKLVRRQRGGYCFEANGLFLAALLAAGFRARPLLARVVVAGTTTSRTHQLSLVNVAGRYWIADVGFGSRTPRAVLPLAFGTVTRCDGYRYRLTGSELGHVLQTDNGQGWSDLYVFDLCPVVPADIVCANHYTSTSPLSFFTTARIAVRHTERGMVRVFNFNCTEVEDGAETTTTLPDDEGYLARLERDVGIVIDAEYATLAAVVL